MQSWGYLSGLLRSERIYALTDNQFNTFAETPNTDSLFKSLEDTAYSSFFQDHSLKEFSNILDMFYQQKFDTIKQIVPCPIIMLMYSLKIDLNNLKLCYKAKVNQKEVSWNQLSEAGSISPERMFSIIENELFDELPKPVAHALIELSQNLNDNLRRIDFLIDKAYYSYRLEILKQACIHEPDYYQPILDLYRKEVDCENIKNIFRAKKMDLDRDSFADLLIPGAYISPGFFIDQANISPEDLPDLIRDTSYGEPLSQGIDFWAAEKSCTILEKNIDEYLLDQVKNFSYFSEGPAVVEETLRTLLIELKNLKLIIIGKLNGMGVDEIKERIRNVGK